MQNLGPGGGQSEIFQNWGGGGGNGMRVSN